MNRIAVVTGANKGIGYAIVRGLAPKFDGIVYLTSRNEDLGRKAMNELVSSGLRNIKYHQLDIDDSESILRFANYIKNTHGGLDVLINNAAIAFKVQDPAPFSIQASETVRINFTDTLNLCSALFPLLRPHARVVNVASRCGMLKKIPSEFIRNRFTDPNATIDDIVQLLDEFVEAAQTGSHVSLGFGNSAYGLSKVALIAVTRIQQRLFDKNQRSDDIIVNALCPGYVNTDMSSHKGRLTPEQGAVTPIHLALLPPNTESNPRGELWAELQPLDWEDLNWTWD